MSENQVNDNLVLICGEPATGKSACLRNLKNPERVIYLNCESGKKLPFKAKFKQLVITDPYQVYEAFEYVKEHTEYHTIVIDGLNFLMDMFESLYIIGSSDTRSAWQDYAQFFKNLMQLHVATSKCNVIITAHTKATYNEAQQIMVVAVPIKGSLANQGVEAFFSSIVATKKVTIKDLEKYTENNALLDISEEERALGFKYIFQTKITANTVNERIRNPMGCFSNSETFINNDAQLVLDKFHEYYN